ncbi:MAG: bifunctional demethylmenaquinone methyltransferase/2-methoxy-6-polyprenyl-1,4-benzoquinol methylase UbiE [Polyangiales bacterium]
MSVAQPPSEAPTGSASGTSASTALRLGSGDMFDRIAGRYDLLNRVLSLGIDQRWRRRTVESLCLDDAERALDLATGTADLAVRMAKQYPALRVDGVDPSRNMLRAGASKAERSGVGDRVALVRGDAQEIPYEADTFDAVSIAFGIRNVPDRSKALREMARVTRKGGRVAILELSEPSSGVLGPLARFHIRQVVPRIGALVSGAREYRYLEESIRAFPAPDAFAAQMAEAGLQVLRVEPLTFGVCCLYVAEPA